VRYHSSWIPGVFLTGEGKLLLMMWRDRLGTGAQQEAIAAMAVAANSLLLIFDRETRPPEFEDAASKLGDLQIENLESGTHPPRARMSSSRMRLRCVERESLVMGVGIDAQCIPTTGD
jgi:hypothetical protein